MSQSPNRTAAFAVWLRKVRQVLPLTRHELALATGLSETLLRKAESGRYPLAAPTAARIVRAVAVRDPALAAESPVMGELGEVMIRVRGERLHLHLELDLCALQELDAKSPLRTGKQAGLTLALAVVEKKPAP